MRNSSMVSEGPGRVVKERFVGVIKDLGSEAWDELKTSIDKAWDEIKLGIDDGVHTASEAFSRGWNEFSVGMDRAKDKLLKSPKTATKNARKGQRKIREKENLN